MNKTPLKSSLASYLLLTCNSCDRIIYTDEMSENEFLKNGGYCPECEKEIFKIK